MKSLADVFAASLGHELFGGSVQIYVESIKPCGVRDPFKNLCPGFSAACRGVYTWQEEQRSFDYKRLCIGLEPEFAERSEEDDGRYWTTEYNDGDFDPIAYEIMEQCDFFLAAYGLDENRSLESQNFYSEENLAFRLPATAVDLLLNKKIDRSIVVFKDAHLNDRVELNEQWQKVLGAIDARGGFDALKLKYVYRNGFDSKNGPIQRVVFEPKRRRNRPLVLNETLTPFHEEVLAEFSRQSFGDEQTVRELIVRDAQTVPYFVVDEACRMIGLDKKATFEDAQTVKTTHRR